MFGGGGEEKMLPWYLDQSQHWIKLHHAEENAHFVLTNSARFFFSSALFLTGNSSWWLLDPFFHFRPVSETGNHTSYVRSGPPASRLAFMLQLFSLFTSLTEILFLHVWVGCRNLPEDYFYFMLILKFFPKSKLDAQSFFSFLLKHLTRAGEAPSSQSISIPGGSSPQTLGLPATASHWPSGPTVPCD